MVKTYEAVATWSEDGWWVAEVLGVPMGYTQARRWVEVEPMVRDLLAALLDVPEGEVAVVVRPSGEWADAVCQAQVARSLAEETAARAQAQERGVALALYARGLAGRDIAALLGKSPSWVSGVVRERQAA